MKPSLRRLSSPSPLRTTFTSRKWPVPFVLLGFLVAGCGSDDDKIDKTPEQLNFSAKSAADAGVYGLAKGTRAEPTTNYTTVRDRSGTISMEVPADWDDVNQDATGPFEAGVAVSPDIEAWNTGWETPGAWVGASQALGKQIASAAIPELEVPTVYASVSPRDVLKQDCDPTIQTSIIGQQREENVFDQALGDIVDFGLVDSYSNCGGNGAALIDFGALSKDRTTFIYGQFTAVSSADNRHTERALSTLDIRAASLPTPEPERTRPEFTVP
jgi:hypothetical protein